MSSLYPEHEKLKAISDKSQICGEFIEWLQSQGFFIEHNGKGDWPQFVLRRQLAKFFGIDEEKLENEKMVMLDEMRRLNQ